MKKMLLLAVALYALTRADYLDFGENNIPIVLISVGGVTGVAPASSAMR